MRELGFEFRLCLAMLSLAGIIFVADAQSPATRPAFEDYPAPQIWSGNVAPLNLALPAERKFKTRLTEAASKAPSFADHCSFTARGCGSNCAAGAFLDFETGRVVPPPLTVGTTGPSRWEFCSAASRGAGLWTRADSRLLILRCGKKLIERLNDVVPDTYYFVWENSRFKQIAQVRADTTPQPN